MFFFILQYENRKSRGFCNAVISSVVCSLVLFHGGGLKVLRCVFSLQCILYEVHLLNFGITVEGCSRVCCKSETSSRNASSSTMKNIHSDLELKNISGNAVKIKIVIMINRFTVISF